MITLDPLPMTEAQTFWRDKIQLGPGEFAKLSAEARVRAFAVSGIARGDELATVFAALFRAIDQGTTLEEFKRDCAGIFERRGWTGKRAWRIDNIFRTNIQTAYNVGQYKQLAEARDVLPVWQYSAINDARTRPTHRAMDGRAWPADHPMWDVWFPPNGYRCRCSVIGLTAGQARERGLRVEEQDPTHTLVEPTDPETGARLPARQLLPDPGFKHNPGKVYWGAMGQTLADKAGAWPTLIAGPVIGDMVQGPVFARWLSDPDGEFPVGLLAEEDAGLIGARSRVALLSAETAAKQARHHPELLPSEYAAIQAAMERGLRTQDSPTSLVFMLNEARGYVAVVKATVSGSKVFVTSFRRLSTDEVKRDEEIQRLLKRGETARGGGSRPA